MFKNKTSKLIGACWSYYYAPWSEMKGAKTKGLDASQPRKS